MGVGRPLRRKTIMYSNKEIIEVMGRIITSCNEGYEILSGLKGAMPLRVLLDATRRFAELLGDQLKGIKYREYKKENK